VRRRDLVATALGRRLGPNLSVIVIGMASAAHDEAPRSSSRVEAPTVGIGQRPRC
jgi:hypothetical protein